MKIKVGMAVSIVREAPKNWQGRGDYDSPLRSRLGTVAYIHPRGYFFVVQLYKNGKAIYKQSFRLEDISILKGKEKRCFLKEITS